MNRIKAHRDRLVAVATVGVMYALLAPSTAQGTSYFCGPVPLRIMWADAVVVGRTVSVDERELRPGMVSRTYRFHIEQVIKDTSPPIGEFITEESGPRFVPGVTHLPPPQWGSYVVFMYRNQEGKLRSGPCTISGKAADIAQLARMVKVARNPSEYLDSSDETDIESVLYWIRRHYFPRSNPYDERPTPEAFSQIGRAAAIKYVLHQVDHQHGSLFELAIGVLAGFHPPSSFDRLVIGLGSPEGGVIQSVAAGLGRLGDTRAVLPLIDCLQRLRGSRKTLVEKLEDAWTPEGEHYQRKVMKPDRTYDQVAHHIMDALGRLGDSRAVDELLLNLDGPAVWSTAKALSDIGDSRAVEPLLRMAWKGKINFEPFLAFSDSRIIQESRERVHDHPLAPNLLAAKGDPEAREFMLRLLRQGHRDGAIWVGVTRELSAREDLIRALRHGKSIAAIDVAYALGRLRTFDVIPEILNRPEDVLGMSKRIYFLFGLIDIELPGKKTMQPEELQAYVRQRLAEISKQENWSEQQREAAKRLRKIVEDDLSPNQKPYVYVGIFSNYGPWVPPAGLPEMPDPLEPKPLHAFLRKNRKRIGKMLRAADFADKAKVLTAVARTEITLSGDLFVTLSLDPSRYVRSAAGGVIRKNGIKLTPDQVKRWALDGDYAAIEQALAYIHQNPHKKYAPTVAEVFRRGWHLYDENLFKAIIVTRATDCVPQLRKYLQGEHVDLRRRAALTLAFLGDDSGRALLLQERSRFSTHQYSSSHHYIQRALKIIDPGDE